MGPRLCSDRRAQKGRGRHRAVLDELAQLENIGVQRGRPAPMLGGPVYGNVSTSVIGWVPLKPHLGISCLLLIFAGRPRRTPFSRAENPPITFICELKKQVRRGLVLRGEGQSAISDRAGAAHGNLNPNATERGFKYRKKDLVRGRPLARCATEGIARHTLLARNSRTHQRPS